MAHNWNAKIKKTTEGRCSLDDLMRDILYQATENNEVISPELFDRLIQKYLLENVESDIKKYIDEGNTIIVDKDSLGPCCKLVWKKLKNVTGFGVKTKVENGIKTIISVDENSDTFKKGVRVGQIVLESENNCIRSDRSIKAKIKDLDGTIKDINFYPVGNLTFDVPQYVFDKEYFEKNKNECLSWFGCAGLKKMKNI